MDKRIEAICGDAIAELQKMENESVNLIVTDPPYNLNKDYGTSQDKLKFEDYLEFSRLWLKEAKRVLKPDGTIYIFMGMKYISYIYTILEQELGMTFNSWITWYYTQGIGKTKGFSPRNVWEFSHMHYCNKNRKKHPTQKPEGLYERMILASSKENDVVVDPFVGSGTCLRVCQQTNRRGVGIDINPEYIEMTEERLLEEFKGFDSIDEKMKRCPNDLNDANVRIEYIENHIQWFLKNHPDAITEFLEEVKQKYLTKMIETGQIWIFDQYGITI